MFPARHPPDVLMWPQRVCDTWGHHGVMGGPTPPQLLTTAAEGAGNDLRHHRLVSHTQKKGKKGAVMYKCGIFLGSCYFSGQVEEAKLGQMTGVI